MAKLLVVWCVERFRWRACLDGHVKVFQGEHALEFCKDGVPSQFHSGRAETDASSPRTELLTGGLLTVVKLHTVVPSHFSGSVSDVRIYRQDAVADGNYSFRPRSSSASKL
jgi:hypothetical protein